MKFKMKKMFTFNLHLSITFSLWSMCFSVEYVNPHKSGRLCFDAGLPSILGMKLMPIKVVRLTDF